MLSCDILLGEYKQNPMLSQTLKSNKNKNDIDGSHNADDREFESAHFKSNAKCGTPCIL